MTIVGQNIKKRRKELKMSQSELARRSGISQSAISDIESLTVTKSPSTETIKMIAPALGCTVAELMGEDAESNQPPISGLEMQIIYALRQHPEHLATICKILDVDTGKSGIVSA